MFTYFYVFVRVFYVCFVYYWQDSMAQALAQDSMAQEKNLARNGNGNDNGMEMEWQYLKTHESTKKRTKIHKDA